MNSKGFRFFYSGQIFWVLLLLLAACAAPPVVTSPPPPITPPPVVEVPPPVEAPPVVPPVETYTMVPWGDIAGWERDDLAQALDPLLKSCRVLKKREGWTEVCAEAATLEGADRETLRQFFESRFVPWQVRDAEGGEIGTITGYYVPDIRGSRVPSSKYPYPLYGVPDDLLVVDLREIYPELKDYRLRGRLEGRKVIPYWTRGDIDAGQGRPTAKILFYVADPVELFFLHIQGSGRILLENGERVMVNYGDQNGHPYRSIGKLLIERGAMTREQMSMQNIKAWARQNPEQVKTLLAENPSYVFFVERPGPLESPPGALGVPLTPGRSLAVDPKTIPLGAPVFLDTTWPSSSEPLQRLMLAQDTGGAIKGKIRGDFFWGMGDDAGSQAGRMKQKGRFWLLLPQGVTPPQP
ncbi:murein transglycosylase A [Desulfuromonas acetexigens]|uniref:peptidoglycan lytic exotransglycosylase n=1 Tax=Trichloromonas acetexigens TaxID=38815 RepID=A0A550JJJ2_9BACT|nr:MltA domain-containing protein [Desulfuromonas acetexigens]TRO83390.1 transglycosylase [Desulfuromonas acetexigens]